MLLISHRGNLHGPNPTEENKIEYILSALSAGFHVEVDVHHVDGILYLGHDEPQVPLPSDWLHNEKLWFHCKNSEALMYLQMFDVRERIKYFWHQEDDYTLVSNKKVWVYPGKKLFYNSIAVLPEQAYDGDLKACYAICTDFPYKYKELYESSNIN